MITWNTEINAPCCPGEILGPNGQSILVQTDWDYPGVASTFGWSIQDVQAQGTRYYGLAPCDHSGTDGTVDCPDCGLKAITFINAAGNWLRENDGATADDPGYF